MLGNLLWRGLLAGLIAGVVGFGIARTIGEPHVDVAIAYEEYLDALDPTPAVAEPGDAPLVTRDEQRNSGLATGALIFGVAIGGIFSLVFAGALGRLGPVTIRGTAALLGLLGFVAVYLTPFLKYPANPPAVGADDTIGRRTGWYLLTILAAIVAMVAAVVARKRLVERLGPWNATLAAALGYAVVIVVAWSAFPSFDEVPQAALPTVVGAVGDAGVTFPPTTLWRFRFASLAIQAAIWAVVALGFGTLAERFFRTSGAPRRRAADDPLITAHRV